jgi:DNA polymerase-1
MLVIDFETDGIDPRPSYPPEPRGVAICDGKTQTYTRDFTRLARLWNTQPMIFHNAAFDVAVATEKLGLPMPDWQNIHDTMWLAFFDNPYRPKLALKSLAQEVLGTPPDEQEDVKEWIMANVPEAKRKTVNWGYWIAKAPMELLRPYAIGDVNRTRQLFDAFGETREKMGEAYDRERRLLPMLLDNSREGVRINLFALRRDSKIYEAALVKTDARICKLLGRTFNVGSGEELADALEASGKGSGFLETARGARSVSKQSLAQAELDPDVAELLNYRGRLETSLTTFLRPWLEMAEQTDGRIHFGWNQVRGDGTGARTGRLSSSPNCQNIPKGFSIDAPKGLPPLPHLRGYLLPDEGETWVRLDFSQQELRVLAHFENDELLEMYRKNPKVDMHKTVAGIMGIERGPAKTIGFGLLYGMGIAELASRLGIDVDEARVLKDRYLEALPGLRSLIRDLNLRGRNGEQIRTWGGRYYDVEPAKIVKGKLRTFEYKLLNYLIQGSSADMTKEAMCRLNEAGLPGRMLVSVHDEIDWSVPKDKNFGPTVRKIHGIMTGIEFDCPLRSDVEAGANWGELIGLNMGDK